MVATDRVVRSKPGVRRGRHFAAAGAKLDWQTLLGVLAFGVLLALSLPGVEVARADAAAAQADGEAPQQCSAPQASPRMEVYIPRPLADAGRGQGSPEVVVLNTRGYNHGPAPRVDPQTLAREAATPPH